MVAARVASVQLRKSMHSMSFSSGSNNLPDCGGVSACLVLFVLVFSWWLPTVPLGFYFFRVSWQVPFNSLKVKLLAGDLTTKFLLTGIARFWSQGTDGHKGRGKKKGCVGARRGCRCFEARIPYSWVGLKEIRKRTNNVERIPSILTHILFDQSKSES